MRGGFLCKKLKCTGELNAAGANLEPAVLGVLRLGSVSLSKGILPLGTAVNPLNKEIPEQTPN